MSPGVIRDKIAEMVEPLHLNGNEGFPITIVSSDVFTCLETFAADIGIIEVTNENGPPSVRLVLDPGPGRVGQPVPIEIEPKSAIAIRVPRRSYKLSMFRGESQLGERLDLDLAAKTIDSFDVPGVTPDPSVKASNLEKAANAGESLGADLKDVDATRQNAMIAYEAVDDSTNAERLAKILGPVGGPTNLRLTLDGKPVVAANHEPPPPRNQSSNVIVPVASRLPAKQHRLTVSFDYDFSRTRACRPGQTRRCVQEFRVNEISYLKPRTLFTIPVPGGSTEFLKGITGTSDSVQFSADRGKTTIAVVAVDARGGESNPTSAWIKRHSWIIFAL